MIPACGKEFLAAMEYSAVGIISMTRSEISPVIKPRHSDLHYRPRGSPLARQQAEHLLRRVVSEKRAPAPDFFVCRKRPQCLLTVHPEREFYSFRPACEPHAEEIAVAAPSDIECIAAIGQKYLRQSRADIGVEGCQGTFNRIADDPILVRCSALGFTRGNDMQSRRFYSQWILDNPDGRISKRLAHAPSTSHLPRLIRQLS